MVILRSSVLLHDLTFEISIQKCQMIVKFNRPIILLTTMQGS